MIDLLIIFAVVFLDQLSKFLAPKLGLAIVKNTGIVFGLFPNFAWGVVIAFVLLGFLLNFFRKSNFQSLGSRDFFQFPIYLILGGGVSNLLDRLYFGYIRDFIDLKIWPVFNLADAAICLGVGLLLIQQVKVDRRHI